MFDIFVIVVMFAREQGYKWFIVFMVTMFFCNIHIHILLALYHLDLTRHSFNSSTLNQESVDC